MTVTEVRALFDSLADEVDRSFISDAQARAALSRAYGEFRRVVTRGDAWFYAEPVVLTISGSSYNLATGPVSILGASPTNTKMVRALVVELWNATTGTSRGFFKPAAMTEDAMLPGSEPFADTVGTFIIRGRELIFDRTLATTVRLWYVPVSTVNWNLDGPGDTEYIDDLDDSFHDLIALLAITNYYNLRDGAEWGAITNRKRELLGDLHQHLTAERQDGGSVARDTFFGRL